LITAFSLISLIQAPKRLVELFPGIRIWLEIYLKIVPFLIVVLLLSFRRADVVPSNHQISLFHDFVALPVLVPKVNVFILNPVRKLFSRIFGVLIVLLFQLLQTPPAFLLMAQSELITQFMLISQFVISVGAEHAGVSMGVTQQMGQLFHFMVDLAKIRQRVDLIIAIFSSVMVVIAFIRVNIVQHLSHIVIFILMKCPYRLFGAREVLFDATFVISLVMATMALELAQMLEVASLSQTVISMVHFPLAIFTVITVLIMQMLFSRIFQFHIITSLSVQVLLFPLLSLNHLLFSLHPLSFGFPSRFRVLVVLFHPFLAIPPGIFAFHLFSLDLLSFQLHSAFPLPARLSRRPASVNQVYRFSDMKD
jgi:hypothetical protein